MIITAATPGTLTFTLSCTGTNNLPVTDTVVVPVISNTPDLTFQSLTYDTCTAAEVNRTSNRCPRTTASFVIRNLGVAIPANRAIPYRLERQVGASWEPIPGASGTIAGLGALQNSSVITVTIPDLPAGVRQRFVARVNQAPDNRTQANPAIGEIRLGNNATVTPFFTIVGVPPDYTATNFSITRTCTVPAALNQATGECPQTDVRGIVRNIGGGTPAGSGNYIIERNQGGNTWVPVTTARPLPALAAGASITVTNRVLNLPLGTNLLRLLVRSVPAETNVANNASNEDKVIVPPLPPQCNNDRDDADPEDFLEDEEDPGCWDSNGKYDRTDTNEASAIPRPTLTLTANPTIVRYGDRATISYTIESVYDVECRLYGPGMSSEVISYSYTPGEGVSVLRPRPALETGAVTGTQTFRLSCIPPEGTVDGVTAATTEAAEATVTVEVVPEAQET